MNGNTFIVVLLAFLGGTVFITVLPKQQPKGVETPQDAKRSTTKLVVWACLINGFAWVWCSYLLAYLGRAEIAESLSKVAITEIIGVVLVYAVKSLAENLSKNNAWPDKPVRQGKQDCD